MLIQQTQEPPMRYLLCRGIDLVDVITRTGALGSLPGVEVSVSLNRDVLISTELEHSIVREAIRDLEAARNWETVE